ncbi:MAG: alpha/beta fold hydrolase [Mycobacteriales bacterium]
MTETVPCTARLRGEDLTYLDAGSGPPIVFVHGLLGSYRIWAHLVAVLAADHRVVAPDLFGHGGSAKPRGDYSLGAQAATLRDLLDELELGRVTLVGHSLGGGVALQFMYLFPDRVERLVLVSSGGLGRELNPLLRAPTLPGAEWVLPLLASRWARSRVEGIGRGVGRMLTRAGIRPNADVSEAWLGFVSLGDADSRRAFLASVRAVIDPGGQTVTAGPLLHRLGAVPTLLVWGGRDRMIPALHAAAAATAIPRSRVEIFERAGHFPHLDEPDRFLRVLRDFTAGGPRVRAAAPPAPSAGLWSETRITEDRAGSLPDLAELGAEINRNVLAEKLVE